MRDNSHMYKKILSLVLLVVAVIVGASTALAAGPPPPAPTGGLIGKAITMGIVALVGYKFLNKK